jgi:hypothetical protein
MHGEDARPVDGVYLSAAIDQGGTSWLYTGLVTDFWFDENANLDRIALTLTSRRPLSADKPAITRDNVDTASSDNEYSDVEGFVFIFKYSDAKTITLDYVHLEPTKDS